MKGKLLTIAGIVLIFGYFISESFKNPTSADPNQVIMVGNDTLGRDWGAIADQKEREKASGVSETANAEEKDGTKNANTADAYGNANLISGDEDPYTKDKLNAGNYTSVQAPDGREVITGYTQPGQAENSSTQNFETRHQSESNQPTITSEPVMPTRE